MKASILRPILAGSGLLAALSLTSPVQAAPDLAKGRQLHDAQCVQCHIGVVGEDTSKIYTRPNRIIKSRAALSQRVAFCATQINAGWFPEDEEAVAAYLNDKFYKFK
jgi:mono/diheme cytochrome c family protein